MMLSVGAPVGAQVWAEPGTHDRDDDRGRYGRANDYQRQAYDNGYRRGMDRGERDGRDGRAMNYRDEKDYRNGDWGYNARYGSRDYYRQSFRSGLRGRLLRGLQPQHPLRQQAGAPSSAGIRKHLPWFRYSERRLS